MVGLSRYRDGARARRFSTEATLGALEAHPLAAPVTSEARPILRGLFGAPFAHGTAMAIQASVGLEEPAMIAAACAALSAELLVAWDPGRRR
jgi:hypothetical protein